MKKWKTKLTALLSAGVLAVTGSAASLGMSVSAQPSTGSYGDALKLSLYFYDANQCGSDDNCLTWRGACHTYDAEASLSNATGLSSTSLAAIQAANGGSSTVDVSGGYHDAGDHLKFSMTMGFSCTNLAWSYLENPEAYDDTGSTDHLLSILKKTCDYLMKVTYLDDNDDVIAFCYMVGNNTDHDLWSSPESQTYDRPTYWADASHPSIDTSSYMSAALAATSLVFQDVNSDYASQCLKYANALEEFTEKYPQATYDGVGSYYSCGNTADKIPWCDLWCTLANNGGTLPDSYTAEYTPSNGVYNGSYYDYWVYSWDKVWGGYSALLYSLDPVKFSAHGTELVFDINNLVSDKSSYYPIGGWGGSRYNCAWQMYCLTYAKYADQDAYNQYAATQMDCLLGDNSAGRSYLIGYTDTYPEHIHHRAANPTKSTATYVLYGALLGGPDSNGNYDDSTDSYSCTEPALDYNSCLALALAGLYNAYGGSSDYADSVIAAASEINSDYVFDYGGSDTPIPGTTDATTETTTTTTTTEETTTTTTEITSTTTVTEPETTTTTEETTETTTETEPTTVTTTTETFIATESETTTESEATTTVPESTTSISETTTETEPIADTTTTTKVPDSNALYGDVNLNGKVELSDAVLLSKALADVVTLSSEAKANADCCTDSGLTGNDCITLLQFLVGIINKLPQEAT